MPHFEPANDIFVGLDGSSCYVSIADALSMKGKQAVEAVLHFQLDALPSTTRTIFGKSGTADFAFTVSSAGVLVFTSRRNTNVSATTTSAQVLTAGVEYIIKGIDDGSTVKLYVNGDQKGSTGTAGAGAIVKDTNPILIGAEAGGATFTGLRLFGAQVKQDGIVTLRIVPRETSGSTLRDLSGYAQAVTLAGTATEGTTFWWGTSYSREPMFAGAVTL